MPLITTTPFRASAGAPLPPASSSFTFSGVCPQNLDMSSLPGTAVITIKVWGAAGGNPSGTNAVLRGGAGGFAKATFLRSSLSTGIFNICVGGGGQFGGTSGNGGFNGGGSSGSSGGGSGGDGGGYSGVFDGATPLIIAGGGGGSGTLVLTAGRDVQGGPGGGNGGNPNGQNGAGGGKGFGGTQIAGGASSGEFPGGAGSAYQGGFGQDSGGSRDGGGGGGGYYGGGGGGAASTDINVGGGGGGSSYINPIASTSFFDGASTAARQTAPQTGDPDYVVGVAAGSTASQGSGGPGLIVISWV